MAGSRAQVKLRLRKCAAANPGNGLVISKKNGPGGPFTQSFMDRLFYRALDAQYHRLIRKVGFYRNGFGKHPFCCR